MGSGEVIGLLITEIMSVEYHMDVACQASFNCRPY